MIYFDFFHSNVNLVDGYRITKVRRIFYLPITRINPNVAYPRRGKTRQSAPNMGARRLGQDEQYLTVRDILFRARSSRQRRGYHASAAILTGLGMQR
jgi:hypothetical protein